MQRIAVIGAAHMERIQGLLVHLPRYIQPLADLITADGRVCLGAALSIDLTVVEPLILEGLLHGLGLLIRPGKCRKGEKRNDRQEQRETFHR